MRNLRRLSLNIFLLCATSVAVAGGPGTSGGLTLSKPAGARPDALGEAFTAATNDITALSYNPASLASLTVSQASFMLDRGMTGDSFGDFLIGMPLHESAHMGFSVGYYNSGNFDLTDENMNTHSVDGQTDLVAGASYGKDEGDFRWGATGKYLSSKLIDTYSAHAFAMDLGLQMPVGSRMNVGAALQNVGSQLSYVSQKNDLPRVYRAGVNYLFFPNSYQTTVMFDLPYHAIEKEFRPSFGTEVRFGPMAVRAGFQKKSGLGKEFSIGAGFLLGRSAFDYSFGMVEQLKSEQRLSVSMRFGAPSMIPASDYHNRKAPPRLEPPTETVKPKKHTLESKPKKQTGDSEEEKPKSLGSLERKAAPRPKGFEPRNGQLYTVRRGDTLDSLSERFYGDKIFWSRIYAANRHLISDMDNLPVGQKIILP